ncbi:hypothetical protein [Gimesia maris]|uniref:hypothetical protein n=1 Tax=Gimesia maris TaxID=122 RepID=UPI00241D24E9|nr:hypothetical protein [Gimesia maris]|tara:strand:+ start:350155 stop:351471 length:1317 start_codon:yes stop_codon:yes gene_type:complete
MPTPLNQLDFGPHNDAVREVITFAQSGKLLSIPFDQQLAETSGYQIKQILTFEEIDLYRKSMNDCVDDYEPYIKRVDWDELLREDIGKLMNYGDATGEFKAIEKLERSLTSQFDQLWKQFFILVYDQLKDVLIKDETDCIADALYMICKCRALLGRENSSMHETLFPIFQAGGYPCGWSGAFPRGQVVVFVPDSDIPCFFPDKKIVPEPDEEKKLESDCSEKPFSSDQPLLWRGMTSLEGEYAYIGIDEDIELARDDLFDTLWIDEEERDEKESEAVLGDITGEPIPLPERFILALMLKGMERTYLVSHPDSRDMMELSQEIVETGEISGFAFELSSKNQTVRFFHYDEDGYCDEQLEASLDGSTGIQFVSDLRTLEIPLQQENLFEIVNNCFEYHGLCDLKLNYDALITGPDDQGLSTATLKQMPELKYEIDIINLD